MCVIYVEVDTKAMLREENIKRIEWVPEQSLVVIQNVTCFETEENVFNFHTLKKNAMNNCSSSSKL